MRMILTGVVAALAITAAASDASARSHHRTTTVIEDSSSSAIPLTVNRRSWLDPGPATAYGSQASYMAASTQFAKTQDRIFGPDRYGNDVMQGQPYVPGRTVPVVEFSTYPDGSSTVDNVIGEQNYAFNPAAPVPPPAYRPTFDLNDLTPLKP